MLVAPSSQPLSAGKATPDGVDRDARVGRICLAETTNPAWPLRLTVVDMSAEGVGRVCKDAEVAVCDVDDVADMLDV